MNLTCEESRSCFQAATWGFVEVVGQVPPDGWDGPGLGVWSVRDLVGHASRALSTIESYLGHEATEPVIDGPAAYFAVAMGDTSDPEARRRQAEVIAERGRETGAALGADPLGTITDLARRVEQLVLRSADDSLVATPFGTMTLAGYLPTRSFELTVHTLDLTRAIGLTVPAVLHPAVTEACALAGHIGGAHERAADLLLSFTGRSGLPEGLSVV